MGGPQSREVSPNYDSILVKTLFKMAYDKDYVRSPIPDLDLFNAEKKLLESDEDIGVYLIKNLVMTWGDKDETIISAILTMAKELQVEVNLFHPYERCDMVNRDEARELRSILNKCLKKFYTIYDSIRNISVLSIDNAASKNIKWAKKLVDRVDTKQSFCLYLQPELLKFIPGARPAVIGGLCVELDEPHLRLYSDNLDLLTKFFNNKGFSVQDEVKDIPVLTWVNNLAIDVVTMIQVSKLTDELSDRIVGPYVRKRYSRKVSTDLNQLTKDLLGTVNSKGVIDLDSYFYSD